MGFFTCSYGWIADDCVFYCISSLKEAAIGFLGGGASYGFSHFVSFDSDGSAGLGFSSLSCNILSFKAAASGFSWDGPPEDLGVEESFNFIIFLG